MNSFEHGRFYRWALGSSLNRRYFWVESWFSGTEVFIGFVISSKMFVLFDPIRLFPGSAVLMPRHVNLTVFFIE